MRGSGAGAALLDGRARHVRAREPFGEAGHGARLRRRQGRRRVRRRAGRRFTKRLRGYTSTDLPSLHAADDGTRLGIGVAASNTFALYKQRTLAIPAGTPTGLDSFRFHDRGIGLEDRNERVAFFTFDRKEAFSVEARTWAQRLSGAPAGWFGPLEATREQVFAELETTTAGQSVADARVSTRALELSRSARVGVGRRRPAALLGRARAAAVRHLQQRQAGRAGARSDRPERSQDLDDETESLLEAMVETLPFAAPPDGEGPVLTQCRRRAAAAGAVGAGGRGARGRDVRLRPERLLSLYAWLDGQRLGIAAETFAGAWYRALRPGQPVGDAYQDVAARRKKKKGRRMLERFVGDWAELRACLEVAAANRARRRAAVSTDERNSSTATRWLTSERLAEGGFLRVRRLRLQGARGDGSLSNEGHVRLRRAADGRRRRGASTLWHRAPDGVRVLLRDGAARAALVPRPASARRTPRSSPASSRRARTTGPRSNSAPPPKRTRKRASASLPRPSSGSGPPVSHARACSRSCSTSSPPRSPIRRAPSRHRRTARRSRRAPRSSGSRSTRRSARCDDGDIRDLKTELALRRLRAKHATAGIRIRPSRRSRSSCASSVFARCRSRGRVSALRRRSAVAVRPEVRAKCAPRRRARPEAASTANGSGVPRGVGGDDAGALSSASVFCRPPRCG